MLFRITTIQFKCSSCGEESGKYARLELNDKTPVPGGRGEANLVVKCKLCSRVNSAGAYLTSFSFVTEYSSSLSDLIPKSVAAYRQEDSENFRTIVQLECRGIEPTDCFFSRGFVATSESGTTFPEVDLEEGEWVDYDDKNNASVGIYGLTHQFVKL